MFKTFARRFASASASAGAAAPASGSKFAKRWLMDPCTYPILAISVVAAAVTTTSLLHNSAHPIAKWGRKERRAGELETAAETVAFVNHPIRQYGASRRHDVGNQTGVNVEINAGLNSFARLLTGSKPVNSYYHD